MKEKDAIKQNTHRDFGGRIFKNNVFKTLGRYDK